MIAAPHLLTPVTDHEETEYHTSQMGNMCHTIATGSQGREELDGCIANHEILRLDRYRQREDEYSLIRINHSECKQDGIDGTRCTYGSPHVEIIAHSHTGTLTTYHKLIGRHILHDIGNILSCFLKEAGTYAAGYVIKKELLRSPDSLYDTSEHPKGEHIEENMLETTMHEHIRKQLIKMEIGSQEEMKSQYIIEDIPIGSVLSHDQASQKGHHIHYQQILCNYWNIAHNNFCLNY